MKLDNQWILENYDYFLFEAAIYISICGHYLGDTVHISITNIYYFYSTSQLHSNDTSPVKILGNPRKKIFKLMSKSILMEIICPIQAWDDGKFTSVVLTHMF